MWRLDRQASPSSDVAKLTKEDHEVLKKMEESEKAKEKLVATNILCLASMSRVEVLGRDAVTDGLFRFWREREDEEKSNLAVVKLR